MPISRLESESGFSLGRSTEITRDELKFTKFVQRIRKKFSPLFTDVLKTQLLLKGVIAPEDWPVIQEHIQYDFLADGHFAELKDAELLENRLNALQNVEAYVGTFFSKEYVLKKVLRMNDTEIQEMRDQIKKESQIDPLDGGIVVPDGGDGIQRYPVDKMGQPVDPDMDAGDRARLQIGLEPEGEEMPAGEEEPVEAETDPSFIVKGRRK